MFLSSAYCTGFITRLLTYSVENITGTFILESFKKVENVYSYNCLFYLFHFFPGILRGNLALPKYF